MDPWGGFKSQGVPDRFIGRTIVVDAYTSLISNADSLSFLVLPVRGTNLFTGKGPTIHTDAWTFFSSNFTSNVFKAFRTMSLAVRVTPLGPLVNQSGILTLSRGPCELAVTSSAPATADKLLVDDNITRAALMRNPSAISVPLSEGGFALSIHEDPTYEFSSASDYSSGHYWSISPTSGAFREPVDVKHGLIAGVIEGGNSNASFMIEVRHCYEAVPDFESDLYLATSASPAPDDHALNLVAKSSALLPVGDVLSKAGHWSSKIAGLFGPEGMLVGEGIELLTSGFDAVRSVLR
jgi:hypothetical protein